MDRDLVGRLVTLVDQLETKGGVVFPKGMTMRVSKMWRGRANLCSVTPRPDRTYASIRSVGRSSFEIAIGEPSTLKASAAPPPKPKKPGRRELLRVIGRLQDLLGKIDSAYGNDRAVDRAGRIQPLIKEAFDLCVNARKMDPP